MGKSYIQCMYIASSMRDELHMVNLRKLFGKRLEALLLSQENLYHL